MEAKRSYHKICTGSTTLNMMVQNLEEIDRHVLWLACLLDGFFLILHTAQY